MQCDQCFKEIGDANAMTSLDICQLCYTAPHTKELDDIMVNLKQRLPEAPILNKARFTALSEKVTSMVLYFDWHDHMARYVVLRDNEEYVCCMANCDKNNCPVELNKDSNLNFLRGETFINGIKEVLTEFPTYKETGCAFEFFPLIGMRSIGKGVWIGGRNI
jgi:hypothetical protein